MCYLLLVHSPVSRWAELPTDGTDPDIDEHAALIEFLTATDRLLQCSPLAHPATGRAVVVRGGTADVVDLSTSGSAVAGYYLIRARDLDEAISIAARVPDARVGHVEVRPLLALEGISSEPPDSGDVASAGR